MRSKSFSVNNDILKTKALKIAKQKGINRFCASTGWFVRFKHRFGISFKTVQGEEGSVDEETVKAWKSTTLPSLIKDYDEDKIYNCDETSFFFKMIGNRTYEVKGKQAKGQKINKERVTCLLFTNMSGDDRFKPVIIGRTCKAETLLKNKGIGCEYYSNSTAWMCKDFFEDIMYCFNEYIKNQNKKVLLFLDNAPVHKVNLTLSHVKLCFLPKNTTPLLQPLDRGIIAVIKRKYKDKLITKFINDYEANQKSKIDLITAIIWLKNIWDSIPNSTIRNCFMSSGFKNEKRDKIIVSEELDLTNAANIKEITRITNITLSRQSQVDLLELVTEYDKIGFTEPTEEQLKEIEEQKKLEDSLLNIELGIANTRSSGITYYDKKYEAIKKSSILDHIKEIIVYINCKMDNTPKHFNKSLIDLEEYILKKEKTIWKQLLYNESIKKSKRDGNIN